MKALIMNEVNVKEIKFVDGAAGVLVNKVKCVIQEDPLEIDANSAMITDLETILGNQISWLTVHTHLRWFPHLLR